MRRWKPPIERRKPAGRRAALRRGRHRRRGSDIPPPGPFRPAGAAPCTIIRSPALNSPSSHSASPSRRESSPSRTRTRSSIIGTRSACQGLSPSVNVVCSSSTIGGSTVLSAANIQVIARARAFASSGSRPAWCCGDMEHDRPRLEQGEIAFFIGRDLPERMQRQMRGLLHLFERNQANVVGLAHFFERPANAHVPRQSLAAIGRAFKGGDGGGHWKAPGDWVALSMSGTTTIFSSPSIRSCTAY